MYPIADIPRMPGGCEVMIPRSGILGKMGPLAGAAEGAATLRSTRIWMHLFRRFRSSYPLAGAGGRAQPSDHRRDIGKHLPRLRPFGT